MALNDDEKKLLAELTERAKEPEHDDEYEIEVYDTSAGKGARIPYKTGKRWLHETFGIGDSPAPAPAAGEGEGAGGDAPPTGAPTAKGYFGRK